MIPLTLTLSPKGRGDPAPLTPRLRSWRHINPNAKFPLPPGERVRVRGQEHIRQNRLQTMRARYLRQRQTDAEKALWHMLRNRRLGGFKFRRQVPIGRFIADFYCAEVKLIIEADGGQHAECQADLLRDAWLHSQGILPLRFWNHDVLKNPAGVAARIHATAVERLP